MNKEFTTEALQDWISQTYDVSPEQIQVSHDDPVLFYWDKPSLNYAALLEKSAFVGLQASYVFRRPEAQCVVRCYGPPYQYRAFYTTEGPAFGLKLELLYPERGVVVSGSRFFSPIRENPPLISAGHPMYQFEIVPSGTAEDVMYRAYHPESYDTVLREYKPWPGDWAEIEIDSSQLDPSWLPPNYR